MHCHNMTTSYSRLLIHQYSIVPSPLPPPPHPPLPLLQDDFRKSGAIYLLANTIVFATTKASQSGGVDLMWRNTSSLAEQLLLQVIWKNTASLYPLPKKLAKQHRRRISQSRTEQSQTPLSLHRCNSRFRPCCDRTTLRTVDHTCSVSFCIATLSEFRAFLCYLNPEIDNWLPNSIPTIRTWTLRTFEAQKHRIKHDV